MRVEFTTAREEFENFCNKWKIAILLAPSELYLSPELLSKTGIVDVNRKLTKSYGESKIRLTSTMPVLTTTLAKGIISCASKNP